MPVVRRRERLADYSTRHLRRPAIVQPEIQFVDTTPVRVCDKGTGPLPEGNGPGVNPGNADESARHGSGGGGDALEVLGNMRLRAEQLRFFE